MCAELKRKPIGFIRTDEKAEEKKTEALVRTGNRPLDTGSRNLKDSERFALGANGNRKLPPEGPILGLMKVMLEPGVFKSVTASNFVKMRLKSHDGKFAIDLILKTANPGSNLQLVPLIMPAISLHMKPDGLSDLETRTMVMFEDGMGNNRGYAIASIRQVELMNNGWTNKKHVVS